MTDDFEDRWEDDEPTDEPDDDDWEDKWQCCFPDLCVMPSPHMNSECYTAEMAESWIEDQQHPA